MGLQEIIDEIKKDSRDEYDGIINMARLQSTRAVREKEEELKTYYDKERAQLDLDLKRYKAKLYAKAELDAERELEHYKNALIQKLLIGIETEILNRLKSNQETYLNFLTCLIRQAGNLVGGKKLSVSLCVEDEHLFGELKNRVGLDIEKGDSAKIKGGVICICDKVYIDNSIENIIYKLKPDFIKEIAIELSK